MLLLTPVLFLSKLSTVKKAHTCLIPPAAARGHKYLT